MKSAKSIWRKRLRDRRRGLPAHLAHDLAERAAAHLTATAPWRDALHIAVYLSNDGEMSAQALINAARASAKNLYLPTIEDGGLRFRRWDADAELVTNRYGIEEPSPRAPEAQTIQLLITPLVGWTGSGYRLGMGGGYFDRFLADPARRPGLCLGLAYACQREDALEDLREPWDQPLDAVLTEEGLWKCDRPGGSRF